jgi:hypothetical protein
MLDPYRLLSSHGWEGKDTPLRPGALVHPLSLPTYFKSENDQERWDYLFESTAKSIKINVIDGPQDSEDDPRELRDTVSNPRTDAYKTLYSKFIRGEILAGEGELDVADEEAPQKKLKTKSRRRQRKRKRKHDTIVIS